jgi:hypothetical protein
MDRKGILLEDVDRTHLAQDSEKWRALVMPYNGGNILNG